MASNLGLVRGYWEGKGTATSCDRKQWLMIHFPILRGLRTIIYFECVPDCRHPSSPWQRLWWDHPPPGSASWLLCFLSLTCSELGWLPLHIQFTSSGEKSGNSLNAHQQRNGSHTLLHPAKRRTDRAVKKNEGYICELGLAVGQVAEPGSSVIAKGAVVIVGCNIGKCVAEGLEVFVSSCFSLGREVIATEIAKT